MQSAPLPANEEARLAALSALDVLDSRPEAQFDALVRAASIVCGTPISLISLIDAKRQWFKANIGLPGVTETPRDVAFCAHAVLGDDLFEVPDATKDARFADNPLVAGQPDIRFYAGAPVRLSNGHRVGTLCVIDQQPRLLDDKQREVLRCLASAAAHALEGRRSALRLVASEARFRALSDGSPLGIYYTDTQGGCTYTNKRWRQICGLTEEEGLGHFWARLLQPDDRAVVSTRWLQAAREGVEFAIEVPIRRPDGAVRHVHARARAVSDEHGAVTGYVGSVEDVTERHALLARLNENEERLRRLYEATPAMLHSIDGKGRLLAVSDIWLSKMGYTREEVIGRPSSDFLTTQSRDYASKVVLPAFFKAGRCDNIDYQMVTKTGEVIDVMLSAILDRDVRDPSARSMAVIEDVTERHRQQRRLKEALAERETLLREVYHRVKNNLQVVQSLLNLQRRALPEGDARAALDDSVRQVRAMALVHEKLYQTGTLSAISLREYTTDLLNQIGEASRARDRGIALHAEIEPVEASLDVAVPYGLLVAELVGNGLKHAFPDGRRGEIRVRLAWQGESLELEVADNGVSLPEDFDIDASQSMGLQLSASLSSQLGGNLRACDRGGAVFSTALPRLMQLATPAPQGDTAPTMAKLGVVGSPR